jgi:hypothetical protein
MLSRLHMPREGTKMSKVRISPDAIALRVSTNAAGGDPSIDYLTSEVAAALSGCGSDGEFVALRGQDLARLLEDHHHAYVMSLEKLIASGKVFGFDWRRTFWVPMFQFDLGDLSVKQGPRHVWAALAATFDGLTLAAWFVRPSAWLYGRRPVDLLDSNLLDVLQAARSEMTAATAGRGLVRVDTDPSATAPQRPPAESSTERA